MAAATLVQTGNFESGQVQQSAIPIALSSVPKKGDALIAVVAASASAGALAAPDASWAVLDAQRTTANGLAAASWWKIAGSAETTSYAFASGSGTAPDYVSGVIAELASASAAPIDAHLVATGTLIAPAEASTATAPSPTVGDYVLAIIATQSGTDSAGYGASPSAGWTIDQTATPRTNATVLAHLAMTAPDTSTAESFAISPGSSGGDYVSFLIFVRATAGSVSGAAQPAFVPGDIVRTATAVVVRPSGVQITASSPTGGSGTYSYQWHRSTSVPFTPSSATLLTGQTMPALNDQTVAPNTRYYYMLQMHDGSTPQNIANTVPQMVLVPVDFVVVGFVGDGISSGIGTTLVNAVQAAQNAIAGALSTPAKPMVVGAINQAVPQTTTHDWLPGGALLGPAVAAFTGAGARYVVVSLGLEDARDDIATSTTDFLANLRAICAYVLAEVPGAGILVNFPSAFNVAVSSPSTFSQNSLARLASYAGVFTQLVAGSAVGGALTGVVLGDQNAFIYFTEAMFDQLSSDGVHPNDLGAAALGSMWGAAFMAAYNGGFKAIASPSLGIGTQSVVTLAFNPS